MVSDKRLPLLAGQRGIWLADRANPFPGRFVNAQATSFLGEFDSDIFTRAATQLVAETECLRLRIHEGADGLTQGILPPSDGIRLPILDFSAEVDPNAAAETWMNVAHADPIDPAREPPFAWALLRLGSGRTIWSQIYHHVAIDSTGRNLLVARLASIYTALATGRDPAARPSAPDFASLAALENAYLASRQSSTDLAWCLSQLDEPPSVPSPSRRAVASADVGFHRASRTIGPGVMKALSGSVRRLGTTLPQLLCATWAAFLTRISGNDEILIGLQVTGRSAATRESIATLTNVLPLRLRIPKTVSFDQYAIETGRQVRLALRHQRHPHERTRAALGLSPVASDPLVIGFNYAPPAVAATLPGATIATRNLAHGPVRGLTLGVEPCADGSVRLDLDANVRCYSVEEVGHLADRLTLVLHDAVGTDGAAPVSRLAISRPEEQQRMLALASCGHAPGGNATSLPELVTLHHPHDQAAPALIAGDARLSYAMLDAAANRMARHLISLGIGPGKLVALALPRTQTLVVALL
ncbi:MAG TPA: condensation domain-containing protein, partial [Acetobacteraceae bacterium]